MYNFRFLLKVSDNNKLAIHVALSINNYGEHNKVINNTDKTKQEIENNIFCVGYEVGTKSLGETVKMECRLGEKTDRFWFLFVYLFSVYCSLRGRRILVNWARYKLYEWEEEKTRTGSKGIFQFQSQDRYDTYI